MELTDMKMMIYHFPGSYGMTFIKVKNLEALV